MSAALSGFSAPPGRSAMMVTSVAADGTLPSATPPSFTKSFFPRSRTFPTPTTTRRETSSPEGATMSSVAPFLPLNRSAAAARSMRSPAESSTLRVADPNLSPSSQNTTRTPWVGVENGANSSFTEPGMGGGPVDRRHAAECRYGVKSPRLGDRYGLPWRLVQSPQLQRGHTGKKF